MTVPWVEGSASPELLPDEVHVWRAELALPEIDYAGSENTVSDDERVRAARFRFVADARLFLRSRAILRDLLSRYCGWAAVDLVFEYGTYGKPKLRSGMADAFHFNCSHSGNLGLYAFARQRVVGIDVECIQPNLADMNIARHFFASGEFQALSLIPCPARVRAFFSSWTRKEAYVKARGDGLSTFNEFEINVARNEPATLVDGDRVWSVQPFSAKEGFESACAAQGRDWRLRLFDWRPRPSRPVAYSFGSYLDGGDSLC
ncbi:MAG: phosphopantetheine--protein transferase [Candidatus Angelobacter sp.]|nr:phosphopantetheine--protein transferase [Candidatus Angelobacter sp.]